MIGLCIGSGQRPHVSTPEMRWLNLDTQVRWNPDIVCDASDMRAHFEDEEIDVIVAHQVIEHVHLGDFDRTIAECRRVLKPGGSLIVTCPDMYELCAAWMDGRISDYIFMVNVYGAWQGNDADDHHWNYTAKTLTQAIRDAAKWTSVDRFDWREIPGASIAKDWWILGIEAIK